MKLESKWEQKREDGRYIFHKFCELQYTGTLSYLQEPTQTYMYPL